VFEGRGLDKIDIKPTPKKHRGLEVKEQQKGLLREWYFLGIEDLPSEFVVRYDPVLAGLSSECGGLTLRIGPLISGDHIKSLREE
jgi:hypothetical protein